MQDVKPTLEARKDVLRPTDAEAIRLAKTLLRTARYGAVAVIDAETGAPSASRVGVATALDGAPVILASTLAAHTRGLLSDPRCSLLVGEPGKGDPLAHPRISIACRALRLERGSQEQLHAARRYLNRHPKARLYADFGDFSFFRLEPQGASLNGGFGKAYRIEADELLSGPVAGDELAEAEQGAVEHMNKDHSDAVALYARHFARAGEGAWSISGLDAEGIDLVAGERTARIFFDEPVTSASQWHRVLVDMALAARQASAQSETSFIKR